MSALLEAEPFNGVDFYRTAEMDIDRPCIDFQFPSLGVDVVCDLDQRIRAILLSAGGQGKVSLIDLPSSLRREEVREALGEPSKSGAESTSSILGPSGGWDRFLRGKYTIHIEYKIRSDEINMVTLMRNDIVP